MADASDRAKRLLPPDGSYLGSLARHARTIPDQVAIHAISPNANGFSTIRTTYGQLVSAASQYAALYTEHGLAAGDRVLLSISAPDRLLAALVGAIANRLIAVPLQTTTEFRTPELFRERVEGVADDCQPRMAVVDDREAWAQAMQDASLDLPVLECGTVAAVPASEGLPAREPEPSAPAFIQYTSGSTGNPRGVVITHENIAANTRASGVTMEASAAERLLSWLPLHHDMGLVGGLLYPTAWGFPTYVMPPLHFILRPVCWLRAIQHFAATIAVAPTFAYALCSRKIPESQLQGLDLSSCRLAFCGAEPINIDVVTSFCARFAPYGFRPESFYPVYGLAEATLAVAFPRPGEEAVVDWIERDALTRHGEARRAEARAPGAVGMVAVGHALDRHEVQIENPRSRQVCREREVGEIVATGPSISPRYFGDSPSARRTALRTGDLGYLADGRLYVVDRIKDLIIIAGQNFAPSDIEPRAASTPGVRLGRVAAIGLTGTEGTEEVHIIAELDPASWRSQAAICRDIGQRILDTFGLHVSHIALVPPGALPRTSSGKLRRRACRDLYTTGAYSDRVASGRRLALKVERVLQAIQRVVLVRRARSTR